MSAGSGTTLIARKLEEYRKAAREIQALTPAERVCRPFRMRIEDIIELLDYIDRLRSRSNN